jgi:hypothetical protein
MFTWQATEANDDVGDAKALIRRAAELSSDNPYVLVRCASAMVEMGGVDEIEPWVERAKALAGTDVALPDALDWLVGCVHWGAGRLRPRRAAAPRRLLRRSGD